MFERDGGRVRGRRGLLAGAAALVGAGLAKLGSAGRAEAAHDTLTAYLPTNVLHVAQANAVPGVTRLVNNAGAVSAPDYDARGSALMGRGWDDWTGMQAYCFGREGWGLYGATDLGAGVTGASLETGRSVGYPGLTYPSQTGVWGVSEWSGGTGVRGDAPGGNGVVGVSINATGVYGFSTNSNGAIGSSVNNVGVYASSSRNWGLYAVSPVFAGVFSGAVYVNGNFTVTNGAKSAAVRHPDGSHRRVYCQESPEPWFEDFGEADLVDGRAVVRLDPDFDAVVKGENYQVFLTEYGDLGTLYVAERRPHRFEVRSRGGASGTFAYRVAARRKDDVGGRLEKVSVPDFATVKDAPALAEPPRGRAANGKPGRPGR